MDSETIYIIHRLTKMNCHLSWELYKGFSPTWHFCQLPRCMAIMEGLGSKQFNGQHIGCKFWRSLKCQNHRKAKRDKWKLQKHTGKDLAIGRKSRLTGDLFERTPSSLKLPVIPSVPYPDLLNYLLLCSCLHKAEPLSVVKVCLKLIEVMMTLVRRPISPY